MPYAKRKIKKNINFSKYSSLSKVESILLCCLSSGDIHHSVDEIKRKGLIKKLSISQQVEFYIRLSDFFIDEKKDRFNALSYINYIKSKDISFTKDDLKKIIQQYIKLGSPESAVAMISQSAIKGVGPFDFSDADVAILQSASDKINNLYFQKNEHGHDLLLKKLADIIASYKLNILPRIPTLIEIGSTREDIPGQGSTKKIAEFCKKNNVHFITVDMDPHNTQMAREAFEDMGAASFLAVNAKGEDYLKKFDGLIDFIFLDAYDFDHGQHSQIRQKRYKLFLGSRISEYKCHQMHYDCAKSINAKLARDGLVCIDDTWLDNDQNWTAKGTLAMPYLLSNGFQLIEARNRAALLCRKPQSHADYS
jgi:hypothetical protein